jgi:poly(A) polymerase
MTRPSALPAVLHDPALKTVLAALPDTRLVGGAVRDTLAGLPVHDIDLATKWPPDAVMAALRKAGLKAIPTGIAHGTVTAVADHRGFEITTLRRDLATDGRHAVVAFTDDWREDAARRDFTINAMSMDADGQLFDYFGGQEDLRAGRLRFVGDPAARIAEDYLRILRFFRFWARYATEPPDAQTAAALRGGIPGLGQLSVERVWNELSRLLACPNPVPALRLMDALGILAVIVPEGTNAGSLSRLIASEAPPDPILRLAALLAGDAEGLAMRLRLSNAERERLLALRGAPAPRPGDDDDDLRRLLADTEADILIGRSWLAGAATPEWTRLREHLSELPRPIFPLEGRDVLTIGLAPGPAVGAVLRQVRAWWLAGGCRADAAACRAELSRRIDANGKSP